MLDYEDILEHCSFGFAYPKPEATSHEIFLWKSVGLALFTHRNVDFVVAWGDTTAPWCSVHLFNDFASRYKFVLKVKNFHSGFTAKEVMERLEREQIHFEDADLTRIFKKTPLSASQPFTISTGSALGKIVTNNKLTITGSWTYTQFIGREIRHLRLHASFLDATQSSNKSQAPK